MFCFFFFPKKISAGYLFHFSLCGIILQLDSRGSGDGRLWWHLCDAAPCGGRKNQRSTFWGVWDGRCNPKKEAHLCEKQGDFYFEHDVDVEFKILFVYVCLNTHIEQKQPVACAMCLST